MIHRARWLAFATGAAILTWQVANAYRGAFVHRFLVADLVVAALLMIAAALRNNHQSSVALLIAFAATAGVFLSATTGAILVDGFSAGRLMTGLGLMPCLTGMVMVARDGIRTRQ